MYWNLVGVINTPNTNLLQGSNSITSTHSPKRMNENYQPTLDIDASLSLSLPIQYRTYVNIHSPRCGITLLRIQLSICGPSKYKSWMFNKLHKHIQIQIELITSHYYILRAHVAE